MKKKWFIAVMIIAVVAVVLTIVFINLFRDKDTSELASNVNNVVENGYLNEESDEFATIDEYFSSVYSQLTTAAERAEVKNCQDSYRAYLVAGEFFNRQIIFSNYNETYKKERKKIENLFEKAQKSANSLKDYVNSTKEIVGASGYWEANTWANCKQDAQNVFAYTVEAFNRLGDVYLACVPSKITNNELAKLIFNTIENYANTVETNFTTNELSGQELQNFIKTYLTLDGEKAILQYQYSLIMQQKVADIVEKGNTSSYYDDFLDGRLAG